MMLKSKPILSDLLNLLVSHGGKIRSSNSVSIEEVRQATASNRMFVDENSLGFIWMPEFKRVFPETLEEVDIFEKCYPLSIPKNNSNEIFY